MPPGTLVRLTEITIDCRDPRRVAEFWCALLGAPGTNVPMPGWYRIDPLTEGGPMINFQPVPEEKQGKARTHLDLETDDIERAILTVQELGGRDLGERHDYPEGTVRVMADPEDNEFCLVQHY